MTREPDKLSALLASLEPRGASPGFRRRVLAALERPSARRPLWQPLAAAVGAALLLVAALLGVGRVVAPEPATADLAAETRELRRQHAELQRELAALEALAEETEPVLYLGTRDGYDVVVDLAPLLETGRSSAAGAVPAAQRGAGGQPLL